MQKNSKSYKVHVDMIWALKITLLLLTITCTATFEKKNRLRSGQHIALISSTRLRGIDAYNSFTTWEAVKMVFLWNAWESYFSIPTQDRVTKISLNTFYPYKSEHTQWTYINYYFNIASTKHRFTIYINIEPSKCLIVLRLIYTEAQVVC